MKRILLYLLASLPLLCFGEFASAALPAYVQKNLTILYSGSSCQIVGTTTCPSSSATGVSLDYTVTSSSGNSVTVTNSGDTDPPGPSTCTDGSRCTSFHQFWVDPNNPVYYDKNGQQLSLNSSCPQNMICMGFSGQVSQGNTTNISVQFDAKTGLLLSYSYSSVTQGNGTFISSSSSSTQFSLAPPYPLDVVKAGSGTVSSSPAGISCGTTCVADFASGTIVTLNVAADPGFSFSGWGGVCSGTGTCAPTMDSLKGVTATFMQNQTLTVAETGTGSGLVTSSPSGINCSASSNQCSASFASGSVVSLTASASSGSSFAGWSGGGCSGTGTCQVTLTAATTVTATFNAIPVTKMLTVTPSGNGSGTITSTPSGITCGGTCSASFQQGTQVTLTASANSGSSFAGWTGGGCSGTGTCTLTLNNDTSVGASFSQNPSTATLSVSDAGNGSGNVTSSPSGINCGANGNQCNASFTSGSVITLSAAASSGSAFAGWSGGGCGGTGSCQVTLNSATTVTATFSLSAPAMKSLSVSRTGTGSGTVTSTPSGITCGTTCSASFQQGSVVTLGATAGTGSSFSGWSGGGCSGTGNCTITLNSDTTVSAGFSQNPSTAALTISETGNGSGVVTSNPAGINCGGQCRASFSTGTLITLNAFANSGSTFGGWTGGGCSGVRSCTLTLNGDTGVGASFVQNASTQIQLAAAVLPASRSVQVGSTATAFATMINAGPGDASVCSFAPATSIPATFDFQTTDPATNAVTGSPDTPVDIAQGAVQTFVFAITPTAAFPPTDVTLTFSCANAAPAATILGVNTLNVSASASPVPDIVALAASADPGYVDISPSTNSGAFAVATVNVGSAATITASADTGTANLPITLKICQTDQNSGACIQPATPVSAAVTTTIASNATPTFAIFAAGNGVTVPDMPGVNRVFVRFKDAAGVLHGETSVAVRSR